MSVTAIKKGRKVTGYKVRFRDYSGNEKSETYDLKADADSRDAEIRRAKQRKEPIPARGRGGSGQTFEAFARDEWWPQDVVGRSLSPKTQAWYADMLDGYLIPRVGSDALAYIDVDRVLTLRAEIVRDVPGYSAARALKLFRQILDFAVMKGKLPFNPAAILSGKRALPSQKRQSDVRPIPPEVTEKLRAAILRSRSPHRQRDAMLVSLLAYAGLRPEEALALTWDNVKPTTLRVEHANADGQITKTKTDQRRTVKALIPALVDDLAGWRRTSDRTKPSDLVIGQPDGSPWTKTDYGNFRARVFKKHLPAEAHVGARVYDLRHGYGSLLIRQGIDVAQVAKQMGNSPRTMTEHYTHVFDDYHGKPNAMADVVAAARGHFEDTSSTDIEGRAGMPKAA